MFKLEITLTDNEGIELLRSVRVAKQKVLKEADNTPLPKALSLWSIYESRVNLERLLMNAIPKGLQE